MKIELQRVHYIPKELKPGVLYVSEEFCTAAHLCACGCGSKVRTPLGPTEWFLKESNNGPTLRPSVGNWQLPCQSHYWISQGRIKWSKKWTPDEIAKGRRKEHARRCVYYETLENQDGGILRRFWRRMRKLFNR